MRAHPKTRVVSYRFEALPNADERAMCLALEKALREQKITQYDDGRGTSPWFNGAPGPVLRALRNEIITFGYRSVSDVALGAGVVKP